MDNLIYVIGIGEDGAGGLTPDSLGIVNNSEVLLGGERQLNFLAGTEGRKSCCKAGSSLLQTSWRRCGVSGGRWCWPRGPVLFGIAGYLVRRFGPEHVEVIPHYSSVQLAFARLGDSWQDAELISLHGRPIQGLAQRIDGKHKIALLTDENNTPAVIAAYLREFGMMEYEAFVCERLGGAEELCRFWTLEEMETREFAALNVVILRRKQEVSIPMRRGFAYPDEEFRQRKPEKGLITKREVRALVLSELNLSEDAVVWDIGSGSGAVAAECARIARLGKVYALEKSAENLPNMAANRLKFRADFEIIQEKAPQGLAALPDPDAVFIGGSGGELANIIGHSAARLRPEGRIVVGAITVETLHGSMEALKAAGLACEVTMLQASRGKPILGMTRFDGMNPVYVVSGRRLH